MKPHKTEKRPCTQTPSQTVGPYFAYGLSPAQYGVDLPELFGPTLAGPDCPGEPLLVIGQVFDGHWQPITDALVELSQLDAQAKTLAARFIRCFAALVDVAPEPWPMGCMHFTRFAQARHPARSRAACTSLCLCAGFSRTALRGYILQMNRPP